jgi:hypothetical protein
MTRTPTKPLTDKAMQRKLKARAHPDNGGDHELFIWTTNLFELAGEQERSCSGACADQAYRRHASPPASPAENSDRIPYPPCQDFEELTRRALSLAQEVEDLFAEPLRLLSNCQPIERLAREQGRGATYKQLAAIGHAFGMDGAERGRWYKIAESIPLSQRHAGHVLSKLKGRA